MCSSTLRQWNLFFFFVPLQIKRLSPQSGSEKHCLTRAAVSQLSLGRDWSRFDSRAVNTISAYLNSFVSSLLTFRQVGDISYAEPSQLTVIVRWMKKKNLVFDTTFVIRSRSGGRKGNVSSANITTYYLVISTPQLSCWWQWWCSKLMHPH